VVVVGNRRYHPEYHQLVLIVLILSIVNNKPLASWEYSIRPNSLIAVLTTIGKTAMMVIVASCVSQLKWSHFRRPNDLSDMQLYDDASRGPWGAFMMLLRPSSWIRDGLAGLSAIITIMALAIEPMAQQIHSLKCRAH
jgi:Protein of unknown function (DUF3176)